MLQQLVQGAQSLELLGPIEAVAGGRAAGLDEPDPLDVAQHAGRPAGRLRGLVDGERVLGDALNLTTVVSRFTRRSRRGSTCASWSAARRGARARGSRRRRL